jgi:hypothetical protein
MLVQEESPMRKLVLSLVLVAGTIAGVAMLPSKAEAQRWWRRGMYRGYYPGFVYDYPAYSSFYYTPAYSSFYMPTYSSFYYTPTYSSFYTPAYSSSYWSPGYTTMYAPGGFYRSSYYYSPGFYMWP